MNKAEMNNEWEGPDGWTPNPDFWRDDSSKEERPKYKKRKLPTIIFNKSLNLSSNI